MDRNEVIALLNEIDAKRTHLFGEGVNLGEVTEQWVMQLRKYQRSEVNELFNSGGWAIIPHYRYANKVLHELVNALNQQRYEKTPQGIAEKDAMIAEWYKRHPRTETKERPRWRNG